MYYYFLIINLFLRNYKKKEIKIIIITITKKDKMFKNICMEKQKKSLLLAKRTLM